MAQDTPRTNEVWDTADYDSHRRGTMEIMERELNEANLRIAKASQKLKELTGQIRIFLADHKKKYHADRRLHTTPDAS